MRTHFVLRCGACGAPAADCVRVCPYCGKATGFEAAVGSGVREDAQGRVHIEGAHVVLGGAEERACPFCGATNVGGAKHCAHCAAKIVIEHLRISQLTISGGSMTIHAGSTLEVVGRRRQPLHDAAHAGDLERVRQRVDTGSDPDLQDERGRRALHFAAEGGHLEVVRWLLSVGADPRQPDDDGATPRDAAERAGHAAAVQLLDTMG